MSGDVTKIKTIPCWLEYDGEQLGYTDAPVEFTSEPIVKDVQADQAGDEILLSIIQGNNLTIATTLKEFNRTVYEKLVKDSGLATEFTDGVCSVDPGSNTTQALCEDNSGTWTPSASSVIGFGTATRGTNTAALAKTLKLVPLDDTEKENIIYFWKAVPRITGPLPYSGNDEAKLQVEFRALEDTTKPAAIAKAFMGDPAMLPNYIV